MERIKMAALTQEDDKLQIPMICNVGNEIWKSKEAGQSLEEAPTMGDPEKRAVMMEAVAASCYLLAGAAVVVLRHPESVRLARAFVELMVNGGMATDVAGIAKVLEAKEADLLSVSPEPNLDFGAPEAAPKEKAEKPKKAAPPPKEKKEEKPAPPPKADKKVVELKPKEEVKPKADEEAKKKAEADAMAKAEREAKAKAEAEAKAKADEEAKKKAEADAMAKAEQEAKAKAEAEAKARVEAKTKEKEDLQALRLKRVQEREKLEAQRKAQEAGAGPKSAAQSQKDLVDRLIENVDRIHRRV
jgi:acetyl-CoA decarbonylase/synthase complex subunit delta